MLDPRVGEVEGGCGTIKCEKSRENITLPFRSQLEIVALVFQKGSNLHSKGPCSDCRFEMRSVTC